MTSYTAFPRLGIPPEKYSARYMRDLLRAFDVLSQVISASGASIYLPTEGKVFIGGVSWSSASGSPEGVVTAEPGSLYTDSDGGAGTTLYVKESGSSNTGWVAK